MGRGNWIPKDYEKLNHEPYYVDFSDFLDDDDNSDWWKEVMEDFSPILENIDGYNLLVGSDHRNTWYDGDIVVAESDTTYIVAEGGACHWSVGFHIVPKPNVRDDAEADTEDDENLTLQENEKRIIAIGDKAEEDAIDKCSEDYKKLLAAVKQQYHHRVRVRTSVWTSALA